MAGALEEVDFETGEPVSQVLQQRLGLGLLSAYWARGEDVGDREVLERLAEAAGMPAERVVAAIEDDSRQRPCASTSSAPPSSASAPSRPSCSDGASR